MNDEYASFSNPASRCSDTHDQLDHVYDSAEVHHLTNGEKQQQCNTVQHGSTEYNPIDCDLTVQCHVYDKAEENQGAQQIECEHLSMQLKSNTERFGLHMYVNVKPHEKQVGCSEGI